MDSSPSSLDLLSSSPCGHALLPCPTPPVPSPDSPARLPLPNSPPLPTTALHGSSSVIAPVCSTARQPPCGCTATSPHRHGRAQCRAMPRRPVWAVPGPGCRHGGTTRHGTANLSCHVVSCLAVPCLIMPMLVSCRAARLATYRERRASRQMP